MRVLLATTNQGKIREIEAALRPLTLTMVSLHDFPEIPEAPETGSTFAENAHMKAEYYSVRTGMPALADDSGLTVDALGGAPGVHSARLASSDEKRIARILEMLREQEGHGQVSRSARFICAMCLFFPDRPAVEVEGVVEGRIVEPAGDHGFGYDPIFYYPPLGKTFAEIPMAEKNRISHRARALARLREVLESRA